MKGRVYLNKPTRGPKESRDKAFRDICHNCGTMYWWSYRHKKRKHLFCDNGCYSEYRKNHPEEYPINGEYHSRRNSESKLGEKNPNWKNGVGVFSHRAKAMYGDRCQECGSSEDIHVHHIDLNRENNPLDGSNWRVLCRSCHAKVHNFSDNFKGKEPWRKRRREKRIGKSAKPSHGRSRDAVVTSADTSSRSRR